MKILLMVPKENSLVQVIIFTLFNGKIPSLHLQKTGKIYILGSMKQMIVFICIENIHGSSKILALANNKIPSSNFICQ